MKPISIAVIGAVLTLGACDQIREDPDIQEATDAVQGAINDDGAALKALRDEAQAAKEAQPEEQNVDESQGEAPAP
ncbi:MAG TPA: hypothetical protein VD906_16005 [Caulobacteraceae bacterium]|nr:hypothetical protein [Caulobacteraceae bacterium]